MDLSQIERQRDLIYRRKRNCRVRTMNDAARLIDAVGFCLLFASTKNIELPSLFEAVKGRRNAHIDDWDKDSDLVWVWKNDLPATRRAYYGKAMTGKPIFISLAMLPNVIALIAPDNVNEEYRRGRISLASKRVYDTLSAMGPTPTMALRAATGLDNPRYQRAIDELQRALVILPVGATLEQGAWPSQIFDLVARWFPRQYERAQKIDSDTACRAIVRRYVETTLASTTPTIARTLGLTRDQITSAVDALVARRILSKKDDWIIGNGRQRD
ncbi:MAG: hypothetical protein HZB51_30900 [Chloroflexi bacterium]|nr:hypothetical protein [Chloroflexota bacterium]